MWFPPGFVLGALGRLALRIAPGRLISNRAPASTLTLTLRVQRKHHKLIVVGRCLGRCPRWHRWHDQRRLLLAPSHECGECAYAYDPGGALQPLIEVRGIRNYV